MESPNINIDRLMVNNQLTSEWKRTPLKTYSKKTSPRSSDGISRYGRSHKPKMSGDFLSTDKKVSHYLRIDTDNQMHYFKTSPYMYKKEKSPKMGPKRGPGRPRKHPIEGESPVSRTQIVNESPVKKESPIASLSESPCTSENGGLKRLFSPVKYSPIKTNDLQAPMPTSTQTLPIPTELMDLKSEAISDADSVCEDADWNCGDLAWANISGFPYWPCTLTKDPFESIFKKNKVVGKTRQNRLFLHVRFFGDNGRRSWVVSTHIMPFQGLDSFQNLVDETCTPEMKKRDPRMYKAFFVGSSIRKAWQAAVSEAESLIESPRSERIIYFHNLYPPSPQPSAEPHELLSPLGPEDPPVVKKKRGRKRKRPLTPTLQDGVPEVKKICPTIDLTTEEAKLESNNVNESNCNIGTSDETREETENNNKPVEDEFVEPERIQKSQSEEYDSTTPMKRKYTRRSSSNRKLKENQSKSKAEVTNNDVSHDISKLEAQSGDDTVFEKQKEKRRIRPTSGFETFVNKHFDRICDDNPHLNALDVEKYLERMWSEMTEHQKARYRSRVAEDSESFSDCKEVASDETSRSQSPQPITPATSKGPKRGILLFAGVKAERVCQVCLKGGDIVKCKGPCGGHYHNGCAMKDRSEVSAEIKTSEKRKPGRRPKSRGRPPKLKLEIKQEIEKPIESEDIKIESNIDEAYDPNVNSTSPPVSETEVNCSTISSRKDESIDTENIVVPEQGESKSYNETGESEEAIGTLEELLQEANETCSVKESAEGTTANVTIIDLTEEKEDNSFTVCSSGLDIIDGVIVISNVEKLECDGDSPELLLDLSDSESAGGMAIIEEYPVENSGVEEKVTKPPAIGLESPKVEGAKQPDSDVPFTMTANDVDSKQEVDEKGDLMENELTKGQEMEPEVDGPVVTTEINHSRKKATKEITNNTLLGEIADVKSSNEVTSTESVNFTKPEGKNKKVTKEDNESAKSSDTETDSKGKSRGWMCKLCSEGKDGPCFVCGKFGENRIRCCVGYCGKLYHTECAREWPQNQLSQGPKGRVVLHCPQHVCHTCVSDNPSAMNARFTNEKLVKCIKCPSSYHHGNYCIPAGSDILSSTQIVCPKHYTPTRKGIHHVNAAWCFICAMGGTLICCDWCPTSFHAECLKIAAPEGGYICEDCETGRFPLFGEIVWVKLGAYRWWPAQILFPQEVPDNIRSLPHSSGEFAVKFFGSHDYYWVNRGRVFLYHEGDGGKVNNNKTRVDEVFLRGIEEATEKFAKFVEERNTREATNKPSMKPPKYVRIQSNKMTGTLKNVELDMCHMTPCECEPNQANPCGPDSDCLNRLLMVECNPQVCPARDRCCNQNFEKRLYPPLAPFQTETRGWGLKTLVPLKKGDFVIEYVGEMINESEYQKRLSRMQKNKDENYYFLTIDKDRMLDAGPKGNMARFMNHSCNPNCETQKWTVNGDTRVGLFALCNIPADTELVFNYNLETIGNTKVECKCGAFNCVGFIGAKQPKPQPSTDDSKRRRKKKTKKHSKSNIIRKVTEDNCFTCGVGGELLLCDYSSCPKAYHLSCLGLTKHPAGGWVCPWHQCSVCSASKVQRCTLCINSYCSEHSEGNITMHRTYGLLCYNHTMSDSGSDWSDKVGSSEEEVKPQKTKQSENLVEDISAGNSSVCFPTTSKSIINGNCIEEV